MRDSAGEDKRREIDKWLDRQRERMIDRGMEVVETDVEVGSYSPVQHFESNHHLNIIN